MQSPSAGAVPVGGERMARYMSAALLVSGLACWVVGLPLVNPHHLGSIGLIAILPLPIVVAYALIIVGFALSLSEGVLSTRLPPLLLLALVLLLHATPAISYETLRYSWAWKHIGVIDYIMRNGHLDPSARFLSAYHNWPGFFVVFAGLGNLFRLDPLAIADLARFSPVVLNLAYLAVLPHLLGNFTRDRRLVWAATAIFVIGNWVGQDYFSPQGVTYLAYLLLLTLVTGPLAQRPTAALLDARGYPQRRPLFWGASPCKPRPEYLPLALLLIVAVTVTHQLTPLFILAALFALFAIGRLSIGYFLFAAVAEAIWLFYFAAPFVAPLLGELVAEFGAIGAGTVNRLVDLEVVSSGQRIVSLGSRILTLAVGAAAVLGLVLRWWRGYRDVTAIALMVAPMPLLVATPYGGEIAFRLYFFSLPLLAFFAATLLVKKSGIGTLRLAFFAIVLMAMVPGFLLANNGKDQQYWFPLDEVAAADWLYRNSKPGEMLIEGSRNYPSQFRNYENFIYVPIIDELPEIEAELTAAPDVLLARWLSQSEKGGYIIITTSQKAMYDNLGLLPAGVLDRIEAALTSSPLLKIVYSSATVVIFALAGAEN